jgi:ribosomal-protein-alanine N-acetyltransferase
MMTRITDMIPAHVPAAAKIEALCFTQPWSEQALLAGVMNPSCIMLAALNEENIVMGWAGAQVVWGEGSVFNICVHPGFRRTGVGEALTRALIDRCAQKRAETLTLEVRASNIPAIRLYEKIGFSPLGLRPNFYDIPREDALMMRYCYPAPRF